MKRLTTDNPVYNVDVMLNYAYAKDGRVFLRYGDGDIDIDLCEYISRMAAGYQCKPTPEEVMEGECMECDCPLGILYVVATQAAELRERLKEFEDREENKDKQSEGEWISVYDRLPEAGKLVLCIWERGDDKQNYGFGRYQAHDVWYVSNEGMPCVTNWMPLPELPKLKGGAE